MATRSYKRDKNGRFAGGGGGAVTTTYGKAGGFAKGNAFGGSRAGGNVRQTAVSKRSTSARIGYAAKGVAREAGKQAVRTGAGAIGAGVAAYGINRVIRGGRISASQRRGGLNSAANRAFRQDQVNRARAARDAGVPRFVVGENRSAGIYRSGLGRAESVRTTSDLGTSLRQAARSTKAGGTPIRLQGGSLQRGTRRGNAWVM